MDIAQESRKMFDQGQVKEAFQLLNNKISTMIANPSTEDEGAQTDNRLE